MDTATDLAGKAGGTILEQGILGALVIILSLALLGAAVFHVLEMRRREKAHDAEVAAKDKTILELNEAWRSDLRTCFSSLAAASDTLKTIGATVLAGRRR